MGEQSEITAKNKTELLAEHRAAYLGPMHSRKWRSIGFFATALLMAVITLACCREINMYYFRSVARSENATLMLKNTTSNNHAPMPKASRTMLSQSHPMI